LDNAVARQVPAAAGLIATLPGHDCTQHGKPDIAWDDPEARVTSWSRCWWVMLLSVLGHLEGADLDDEQSEAVALLALVAGQDVEPADGSDGTHGRWRIARHVAPDRVISAGNWSGSLIVWHSWD